MDELVLLGFVALLWLVVVPIIIMVKLSGLRGKMREQEDYLQWKIAKLEERLNNLESTPGGPPAAETPKTQTAPIAAPQALADQIEKRSPLSAQTPSPAMPAATAPTPQPEPEFTKTPSSLPLNAPAPETLAAPAQATNLETPAPPMAPQTSARPVFQAPELPPISDPVAEIIKFGQQIMRKSNMWVLGGTVLLLCALVFLAKLAIDAGWYTPSLRLASGGLLGIALLIFGWRSRESKPQLGQILQGGGVAAFYLVVVAAVKLHDMIPAAVGLPLLILLVALASILAVMQNAAWMAHVSMVSGFLAPRLMSDGSGNYVALFAVFIILNAGIIFIFTRRNWAHLCLTGFVLTYGIGGIWGLRSYEPHMWTSVEPFLLAFTACYGWIAWRLSGLVCANEPSVSSSATDEGSSSNWIATIFSARYMHLFFALATPAVFLLYQLTVVGHLPFALAFTGLSVGFIYLAGARLIWKRHGTIRVQDAQVYFVLAVAGLNLALLFAGLDTGASRAAMLFYLGVVWVLEGGLFVYIPRHNAANSLARPGFTAWLGTALCLIGSGLSYAYALRLRLEDMSISNGQGADVDIHILVGTILSAVALLAAAWGCRTAFVRTDQDEIKNKLWGGFGSHSPIYPAVFILAGLWLLLGLHTAFVEFDHNLAWSSLALVLFISASMLVRLRLNWDDLRCLLALPLVFALPTLASAAYNIWGMLFATDYVDFSYLALPLDEFLYAAAPLALFFAPVALDYALSRRANSKLHALLRLLAPGLAFAAILACLPSLVYAVLPLDIANTFSGAWFSIIPLALALLTLGLLCRLTTAYVQDSSILRIKTRQAAWFVSAILPLLQVLIWQANTLFAYAVADPLPYIPLLNPLDLGVALACLVVWFWWRKNLAVHGRLSIRPISAMPGVIFVCLMAFAAGHGIILRAVSVWVYDSIYAYDALSQQLAQVCITLYWGVCGFTLMLTGSRLKTRRLWICGASLLLIAAIKAVAVDTSSAATLARVAVYFGIGVLFICTGYFIPVPGSRERETTSESKHPSTPEHASTRE